MAFWVVLKNIYIKVHPRLPVTIVAFEAIFLLQAKFEVYSGLLRRLHFCYELVKYIYLYNIFDLAQGSVTQMTNILV